MNDIRLSQIVSGGMLIEEVFYHDDHVGDVFQYDRDPIWYYRTKYNLMWWRADDKDSAIQNLLGTKSE